MAVAYPPPIFNIAKSINLPKALFTSSLIIPCEQSMPSYLAIGPFTHAKGDHQSVLKRVFIHSLPSMHSTKAIHKGMNCFGIPDITVFAATVYV